MAWLHAPDCAGKQSHSRSGAQYCAGALDCTHEPTPQTDSIQDQDHRLALSVETSLWSLKSSSGPQDWKAENYRSSCMAFLSQICLGKLSMDLTSPLVTHKTSKSWHFWQYRSILLSATEQEYLMELPSYSLLPCIFSREIEFAMSKNQHSLLRCLQLSLVARFKKCSQEERMKGVYLSISFHKPIPCLFLSLAPKFHGSSSV